MRTVKIIILILLSYCLGTMAYALDDQQSHTLTLTLINHTSKTLSFTGVKATNPGNFFAVSPTEVLPGGATTITGTTSEYYDLRGQLRFKDDKGFVSILRVQNSRNINYAQPTFFLQNENYIAYTNSKIYNDDANTHALISSAATVVVHNRLS